MVKPLPCRKKTDHHWSRVTCCSFYSTVKTGEELNRYRRRGATTATLKLFPSIAYLHNKRGVHEYQQCKYYSCGFLTFPKTPSSKICKGIIRLNSMRGSKRCLCYTQMHIIYNTDRSVFCLKWGLPLAKAYLLWELKVFREWVKISYLIRIETKHHLPLK